MQTLYANKMKIEILEKLRNIQKQYDVYASNFQKLSEQHCIMELAQAHGYDEVYEDFYNLLKDEFDIK